MHIAACVTNNSNFPYVHSIVHNIYMYILKQHKHSNPLRMDYYVSKSYRPSQVISRLAELTHTVIKKIGWLIYTIMCILTYLFEILMQHPMRRPVASRGLVCSFDQLGHN